MCLISYCIPTFNSAQYLKQCICSIHAQGIKDYEIIVSDNASTDQTRQVIDELKAPKLKYFCNDSNIGPHRNFDRAISLSSGKYIKTLCADDVLIAGVVQKQLEVFDKYKDVAVVSCDHIVTDEYLKPITVCREAAGYWCGIDITKLCFESLNNHTGGPSNCLYLAGELKCRRFDGSFSYLSDLKINLELLKTHDFFGLGEPGYYYRRHSQSDTELNNPPVARAENWARLVLEFNVFAAKSYKQLLRSHLPYNLRVALKKELRKNHFMRTLISKIFKAVRG